LEIAVGKRVKLGRAQRHRREIRAARRSNSTPFEGGREPSTVAGGPDRIVAEAGERARRLAATFVREGRSIHEVLTLARAALDLAEQGIAGLREEAPPRRPLACRAGCAWCCLLQVPVSAPEVLLIANFLRQRRTAAELEELRARLGEHVAATRGATAEQHLAAHLPCPLLAEQACTVYQVRPLACRGWNSYDALVCQRAVEQVQVPAAHPYLPQIQLTDSVRAGVLAGLAGAGGTVGDPLRPLELTAALQIALESEDAAERWLAGEPVFAPAELPEAEPAKESE
jgi:hypothetical protein